MGKKWKFSYRCAERGIVNEQYEEDRAEEGTLDHTFKDRGLRWDVEGSHKPILLHHHYPHKLSRIL